MTLQPESAARNRYLPSLYNVFMDSSSRSMIADEPSRNNPVIMFAGDAQLRARSRDGLQGNREVMDESQTLMLFASFVAEA